jgi:hypothetical protein
MSDHFRTERLGPPDDAGYFPPLPGWLAARLLREGEQITWVVAPRFAPSWERYITHPLLFVACVALAIGCVAVCALFEDMRSEMLAPAILMGLGIVIGSIFVLGIACGYFTRLVVTNRRLVILQGYEVRHGWDLDALPRSLLRYDRRRGQDEEPTIDLDAVRTMLGSSSTHFAESKTILNFGKELRKIKRRDGDVGP